MSIVRTVLGDINPDELGYTLTHEHLSMDFSHFYRKPPNNIADKLTTGFNRMENIGFLRQYPYSSKINLVLNDNMANSAVIKDVKEFKKWGGGTIVENSSEGLERNVKFYKRVSEEAGVHIVAGTGFYIADMQPDNWLHSKEEDMYDHMLIELTDHCTEDQTVKAGFLGEIGSGWPLKDLERKAIRAVGELQEQSGCGVSFHPHRLPEAPFEIIRLYLEAGGSKEKAVMSHLDRTLTNKESLLDFAELGTYCQFDLFGIEVSYYQLNVETDMPSDAQRLAMMKLLLEDNKYTKKVLMSHDIHTKHRLTNFGGHGYAHILNNVLPKMRTTGFSELAIREITVNNPKEWLAFDPKFCQI